MSLQYAGELLAAFIERAGGSVKGEISTGTVPEGLEPVYVHRQSRTLAEILTGLLLGSNNYIANQVFLEIGGTLGGPVSLEKSLKVANDMLAANGLADAIHLEEGSGISRGNHFTARGLAKVLRPFPAPCHPAPQRRRHLLQDRHLFRRPHLGGLRRHLKTWAGALRDRAQEQRQRDALPAAQSHPVGALADIGSSRLCNKSRSRLVSGNEHAVTRRVPCCLRAYHTPSRIGGCAGGG